MVATLSKWGEGSAGGSLSEAAPFAPTDLPGSSGGGDRVAARDHVGRPQAAPALAGAGPNRGAGGEHVHADPASSRSAQTRAGGGSDAALRAPAAERTVADG